MKKKVAIQGYPGAYHAIAACNFFKEEVEINPCATFADLFKTIQSDSQQIGICAIENTIAGSLLGNYELLFNSGLPVFGEYKQRISHCLAALPGQTLDHIVEVQSHPMALMQCRKFLNEILAHARVVEHEDTALAAKEIAKTAQRGVAAICSLDAARLYGLEVLAKAIETNKHNYTRFLLFAHKELATELSDLKNIDKSSLVFTIPHTEGSLSHILSVLAFYSVNLTKIQSLPIVGKEWEYRFYIDLTFSDYNRYRQAVDAISPLVNELCILGEYEQGEQSEI